MNLDRCKQLGIDDSLIYLELSNEYKKCFEEYLLSKVNLKTYDELINISELGFGLIDKEIELKSKLNEFMNLKYMFILNSFYIEKLSIEQINVLKGNDINSKINLVESTYKEIIKCNYYGKKYVDNISKINYSHSTSSKNYFDNGSLVIAIYYGKNKYNYNSKEGYLKNYSEKREFLNNLSRKIENEISSKLNIKCNVVYEKK